MACHAHFMVARRSAPSSHDYGARHSGTGLSTLGTLAAIGVFLSALALGEGFAMYLVDHFGISQEGPDNPAVLLGCAALVGAAMAGVLTAVELEKRAFRWAVRNER